MATERYNVVVIGAGAAGLVSAYIAAAVKAKVALIERHKMGGDCLNYGCVPSKALIRTSRLIADMRRAHEFGVESATFRIDFAQVMARVHRIIQAIEPHDSVQRYTQLGVECIHGNAEIVDPHTVSVNGRQLRASSIILALGASPLLPPIPGLDRVSPLTSETLWSLQELPKRLCVLGGGPIGSEMAQAFARLGSQVTQVEMGPRLLANEDPDVSAFMEAQFKREGVQVLTQHQAVEVSIEGTQKYLVCKATNTAQITKIPFDQILVAVGRKANTSNIPWQKLGIELNANGTIKVDPYLRTAQKHIFACGDVAGPYQFTHTASHQAWYCAVNALFSPFKKYRANYDVIPWVTFTDPEVAHVGLNETEAARRNLAYDVTTYNLEDLDRAIAEDAAQGFVKVLTPKGKDKIIGATIMGQHAGELITEFVSAMKHGYGLNAILGTIHAYPTFSEANKYVAGEWKREHAPTWVYPILQQFHAWRR